MAGVRRTITAMVIAGLLCSACANVRGTTSVAVSAPAVVVRPHRPSPPVPFTLPSPDVTAPTPPPTDPSVPAAVGSSRAVGSPRAVSSSRAAGAARPPRSVDSTPRSPWDTFNGELTGATHEIARAIGASVAVSAHPDGDPILGLANPLPSGAPRVLLVTSEMGDWLQVLLPVRPNSSLGWIHRSEVELSTATYRVVVDRAAHRVRVFNGDEALVDDVVAVGKASTPTPSGQFFTTELLQPNNPNGDYGPYAFTLSAYSDVYQTFGSGDGAVGMHGTNQPGALGTDASHGCIRLRNETVRHLATFLPLGTPVFIR